MSGGHPKSPEPGPSRFDPNGELDWRDWLLVLGEHIAERLLPAGAQRGHVHGLTQQVHVLAGQVEQRVDIGDAELMRTPAGQHDVVARMDEALADNPEIEARAMLRDKEIGHLGHAEAHADAKAGDAGLSDFELGLADPVAVADADVAIGQPADGEVLPEVARLQVIAAQVVAPVVLRLGLVDHDGALLSAMPREVTLAVAVDVETTRHHRPLDRRLPDTGVNSLAVPRHILWHADVDGYQPGGHAVSSGQRFTTVDLQRNTGQEAVRHGEQHRIGHILSRSDAACGIARADVLE